MNQSSSITELVKALVKARALIKPAIKDTDGQVGQRKVKYADFSAVLDACEDAMEACGLDVIQSPRFEDGQAGVDTLLAHVSGEWVSGSLMLPIGSRADAQAVGSCITYARRYSLEGFLRIRREDDDGTAAVASVQRQAQKIPPPQSQIDQMALKDWQDWIAGKPKIEAFNGRMPRLAELPKSVKGQVWNMCLDHAHASDWAFDSEKKTFFRMDAKVVA